MPCLEQLRCILIGDPRAPFHTCPSEVAWMISDYCTISFASVKSIRLDLLWYLSLPKAPEVPLLGQGFALLDNILSDPRIFAVLESVVVNVAPTPTLLPAQEITQALRDEVQQEAREVFHKTSQRAEEFYVISDDKAYR